MKRFFFCLPLLTSSLLFGLSKPKENLEDNWNYLYKKKSIAVYQEKEVENSYKAEGEISENFFALLAVASDIKRRAEWVPNLMDSVLIEGTLESNEMTLYEQFSLPWPAMNRDAVIHCKLTKDYKNKSLVIIFNQIESPKKPPHKDYIRVPQTKGKMEFRYIDEKRTFARYEIQLDPGGTLPGFIISFFIKQAPYDALIGLIEQIKKTKGEYKEFIKTHQDLADEANKNSTKG